MTALQQQVRPRVQAAVESPARVARWGLALVAVFGVLGVVQINVPYFPLSHLMDLDFEWVPPALYSAALDASAGLGYLALARQGAVPKAGAFLAALFGLMSLDEWFGLHERLEQWTGIDWQKLYAPVVLVAGIGALMVLRAWGRRHSEASLLLVGGGALWFFAQVLEYLQWRGPHHTKVLHYNWYMVPEELMEMSGSLLFLLSALVVLKRVREGRVTA